MLQRIATKRALLLCRPIDIFRLIFQEEEKIHVLLWSYNLVARKRIELMTSALLARRSNQLS